jgi:hypothetical protein
MMIPGFGSIIEYDDYPDYVAPPVIEVIEARPIPALPAEVWHRAEADGDERMRAVRALCGG